jgi:glycosyltransferase involved in cell wall biosynthesis
MRVVVIGFHLDRVGRAPEALLEAWPTLPGLASALARTGLDVSVVQPQPGPRAATIRRDGVVYRFVPERPALLRRGTIGSRPVRAPASASLDAVARLAPSIVHVNGLGVPIHAHFLRKRLPAVRILAQDHADRPPARWRRPAARWAMRAFDGVAFTARAQAERFFRTGVFPPEMPIYEVPESSTGFQYGDPEASRQATGLHGDPCLLWLGHLNANKDPLTVLDGLAAAAPRLPDPHLWCCYRDAPLLDAVQRRIDGDPALAGRVHLLGPRPHDRVETLLQAADALVQGSHREGSGYAVIEAMACGTTPVVTDIPSFRRLTGSVGLLWTPGAARSFSAALLRLMEPGVGDGGRRIRVRRHFEHELSWDAVGHRMESIYRAVVRSGAPLGGRG